MAIIQTIPLGKKYGSMTSSEAQEGTNTESQLISAKVLNDQIDEKISDIGLATVATSGSYNDLNDKPTIPTIPTVNNGTLTIQKNGTTVKTFTANSSANVTADITVPTKVSELTNDSGYITGVSWNNVSGKPSTFTPKAHTHAKSDITDFPTLAAVATSGSYNDLSNKPTIPVIDSTLSATSTNGLQNKAIKTALDGKANSSHNHTKSQITDFPTLATVATSGSYNDLTNKPTIPTVNNATLTIQKNGTTVKTFSANASSNVTANITVPTKTSDLTNDTDYATRTNVANSLQEAKNYTESAVANCVNLANTETITGIKYFTQDIYNKNKNTVVAETPTTDQYIRYRFIDKNNDMLASIQYANRTNGSRDLALFLNTADDKTLGVTLNTNKSFYPLSNNDYSLGASNRKWRSAYITSVNSANITLSSPDFLRCTYGSYGSFWRQDGNDLYLMLTNKDDQYGTWTSARPIAVNLATGVCNINGNAATANAAANDSDGNTITSTYGKLTSANTWSGANVFTDNDLIIKSTTDVVTTTPTSNFYRHFKWLDSNNATTAYIQYCSRTSGVRDLTLYIKDSSNTLLGVTLNSNYEFSGNGNNLWSLGSSTSKWLSAYITTVNASILNIPKNAIVLAFCSSAVNNGSTVAGTALKVAKGGTGGAFTATTETLTGTYRALNTVATNGVGMFVKIV